MDAANAVSNIVRIQSLFQMLSSLHLQTCFYPEQAIIKDGDCFNYIIVGGGSAGCVLANRLTEVEEVKVLLIEAGDDPPIESMVLGLLTITAHTHLDNNYTSEYDYKTQQCHRNHVANLTSGRVLGGGSSINYMLYSRGNPSDYNIWADIVKDKEWSWDSVFPYFIKSERQTDPEILNSTYRKYHGTDGYIGITRQPSNDTIKYFKAIKELGEEVVLDINGDKHVGFTDQMFTIADGVRQSTAYTYLASAKCRKNLFVLKDAMATKIVFDKHNNAIGVNIKTADDFIIFVKACKEVILSAGTLNSPKLLMLSGIGPKEHLHEMGIPVLSDLPVGYNYYDQVAVLLSFQMERSTEPPKEVNLREFPASIFTGYVSLNKSGIYPDYQVFNSIVPNDSPGPLQFCAFSFWLDNEMCQKLFEGGIGRKTLFSELALLYPKSRGRVSLRSANPFHSPVIETGMFNNPKDFDDLVTYVRDYVRILDTSYFKSVDSVPTDITCYKCNDLKRWSDEYWRCYVNCASFTFLHFVGTCAMGSVVDSQLKVLGVKGLRVIDASVMPRQVGGNPNTAVIMIAEKAADMIKMDYQVNSCNAKKNPCRCKSKHD